MTLSQNKIFRYSFSLLTLATLGALAAILYFSRFAEQPLPVLGHLSGFELTDSQGQSFTQSQLKNKIWVADFIFTTCAGPCPVMTRQLASLYRSFLLEKDVDFVSFSVNPEYDTPQILAEYAKGFNADTNRWHFLTGSKDIIQRLAQSDFKIGSKEDPIFHSEKFVLVDRTLRIRGYYEGTENEGRRKLLRDIAKLLKEKNG